MASLFLPADGSLPRSLPREDLLCTEGRPRRPQRVPLLCGRFGLGQAQVQRPRGPPSDSLLGAVPVPSSPALLPLWSGKASRDTHGWASYPISKAMRVNLAEGRSQGCFPKACGMQRSQNETQVTTTVCGSGPALSRSGSVRDPRLQGSWACSLSWSPPFLCGLHPPASRGSSPASPGPWALRAVGHSPRASLGEKQPPFSCLSGDLAPATSSSYLLQGLQVKIPSPGLEITEGSSNHPTEPLLVPCWGWGGWGTSPGPPDLHLQAASCPHPAQGPQEAAAPTPVGCLASQLLTAILPSTTWWHCSLGIFLPPSAWGCTQL